MSALVRLDDLGAVIWMACKVHDRYEGVKKPHGVNEDCEACFALYTLRHARRANSDLVMRSA